MGAVLRALGDAELLDLGGLPAQITKVVQLGATDVAVRVDLDLGDRGGVHGERTLDAHTETDLANGEGLLEARALTADDDALEDLDTGARTLDHAHVDLQRVTGAKVRNVVAKRVAVNEVSRIHESGPFRITEDFKV